MRKNGIHFRKGYSDCPIADLLESNETPDPTFKESLTCSFCGKETSKVMATHGLAKLRKVPTTEILDTPWGIEINESILHIPQKVVACVNCAHHIKPMFAKDGRLISQGTRFDNSLE